MQSYKPGPAYTPILYDFDYADALQRNTFEEVIIPYHALLKHHNGKLLKEEAVEKGIHELLNFHGKILLSSIMPDELLLNPHTFQDFLQTALNAGFDAAIGWDMPVYVDDPREENWRNIEKSLELTQRLAEHIPTLPLSKGADRDQIQYYTSRLKHMGFHAAALHASEYVYYYRSDPLARKLMHMHLQHLTRSFEEVLVIGAVHPIITKILATRYTGLKHASATWQTRTQDLTALAYTTTIDLKHKDMVCYCPACKGKPLTMRGKNDHQRLIDHNLAASSLIVHRQPFSLVTYDYIAQGKTLLAADIHLGENGSRIDELSNLIWSENIKDIVLVGDIVNPHAHIELQELHSLFYAPKIADSNIFIIRGDIDSSQVAITALAEQLLRQNRKNPIDHPLYQAATKETLWLHRLYRRAPTTARILLSDGKKALLTHRLAETTNESLRKALALKKRHGTDLVIAAHLHKTLALPREGVYLLPPSTGSQDPYLALLAEKDGTLHLEEWEEWKR